MAKVTLMFGSKPQGEFNLDKAELTVGRAADCDIVVDNLGVSRHHASFVQDGEQWKIVDKGSNNGTFVGTQKITEHTLKHNDRIVLGKYSLVFDAYTYAEGSAQAQQGAKGGGGMGGSEMTMFVDPAQIQKLQQQVQSGGGRLVLSLNQGGREVRCPLVKAETVIGKGGEADVPIKGFLVKPNQARIVKTDQGHRVISAGGWRGVRVNGSKVSERHLTPGDVIAIAGVEITYKNA